MPWSKIAPTLTEPDMLDETSGCERMVDYPEAIREALDLALSMDPRVLVMYEGEFNVDTPFPQPVAFPVPLGSEINQVCALQPPNDEHLCQLYETLTEPDNLLVVYTLPIPTYFLEYY